MGKVYERFISGKLFLKTAQFPDLFSPNTLSSTPHLSHSLPWTWPWPYHSNNFSPSIISASSILLTNCHPKLYLFSDPFGTCSPFIPPPLHCLLPLSFPHFPLCVALIPCSSIIVILSCTSSCTSLPLCCTHLGKKFITSNSLTAPAPTQLHKAEENSKPCCLISNAWPLTSDGPPWLLGILPVFLRQITLPLF